MNMQDGYRKSFARRIVLAGVAALLLVALTLVAFNSIFASAEAAQAELIRTAAQHALVSCYALEGYYPQDTQLLCSRYGLRYDESRYMVVLDGFAANVMPMVRVLKRGSEPK